MKKPSHKLQEKFDGLADNYDRYRPRYPVILFKKILQAFEGREDLSIVDIGAGTGIALEELLNCFGQSHSYYAIDISSDMIAQGQKKFPTVQWHKDKAEEILPKLPAMDLVVAAQAFQWMDRPRLLSILSTQLRDGGVLAILQNNRAFNDSAFLSDYENLLEQMSPDYSRYYRDFNFLEELREGLNAKPNQLSFYNHKWIMKISVEAFIGMSCSSTQAQRAIKKHGEKYLQRLRALCHDYAQEGYLEILYQSELYIYQK